MTITNNERNYLRNQLQSKLTYAAVGTSTDSPTITDSDLGSRIFSDTIDESAIGASGVVIHTIKLLSAEANNTLTEIGTYDDDPTGAGNLFSRNVFSAIEKTSDFEVEFDIKHEVSNMSGDIYISLVNLYETTITLTGGSTPAYDDTLANIGVDETKQIFVKLNVDHDPDFDADYAFNHDWGQQWDDSENEVDVNLTVDWDTDPGAGNDITVYVEVLQIES